MINRRGPRGSDSAARSRVRWHVVVPVADVVTEVVILPRAECLGGAQAEGSPGGRLMSGFVDRLDSKIRTS
jgi:hypothetical protein